MAQSLYSTLKQLYPNAKLDVLAPSWSRSVLERMPEIHQIIKMPMDHSELNIRDRWRLGRQLAQNGYTHTYVLPNSAKSALIPLFAGIKQRIGWRGEWRYGLLNDLRINKHLFQHMVERYVTLAYKQDTTKNNITLKKCPQPALTVNKIAQKQAMARLHLNPYEKPVIGLCPGSAFGPAKKWPKTYYAEVSRYAIMSGFQIWLFGSKKDKNTCQQIKHTLSREQQSTCRNLAGKTSLTEAIDLLAVCHTVISNDSGLMHVSAAVDCNIIGIYGSSSPQYTPPLTKKMKTVHINIDCQPCFKRICPLNHLNCLNKLTPNIVIDVLKSFIK
ncbi:ADP-heptose--LPS heptosyltransferase 2 [Candidatus Photodesmus blepharus]|uniref:lipopolysaccharide heptosyltransferase II n=2 Tax=Candidatus Photodesmus blepharonis TaxID=1179155 RepID=A0A084CME2_9GAMM|nr:ADP-heptose--LPS heptosyltransferase 2 [Candidatus Photodesmus blepharus]